MKVSRLWELSQTAAIYFRNMLPFQRDNSPLWVFSSTA